MNRLILAAIECRDHAPSAWKVGEAALEAYLASCRREGP